MIWTTMVNCPGQATEEILTFNKTCQRCHKNNKRPTRTNTTNWMVRWWNLKIKEIPNLILSNDYFDFSNFLNSHIRTLWEHHLELWLISVSYTACFTVLFYCFIPPISWTRTSEHYGDITLNSGRFLCHILHVSQFCFSVLFLNSHIWALWEHHLELFLISVSYTAYFTVLF